MDKEREITILIIQMFENVLNEKNIKIPDEEREHLEDEASIYGKTYYKLEDSITELLKASHL